MKNDGISGTPGLSDFFRAFNLLSIHADCKYLDQLWFFKLLLNILNIKILCFSKVFYLTCLDHFDIEKPVFSPAQCMKSKLPVIKSFCYFSSRPAIHPSI